MNIIEIALIIPLALTMRCTPDNVDVASDSLKGSVLDSPNTVMPSEWTGTCWYVCSDGIDSADGLTPATAIKSIRKLQDLQIKPGDAVLFRRGDIWRGTPDSNYILLASNGVTYSSYGSGPKPSIIGSPWNGACYGEWIQTDIPQIFLYSETIEGDVGTLVLDEKMAAYKIVPIELPSGDVHPETYERFDSWRDLKRDLDFYQKDGRIYFCSLFGKPSERFDDIEFNVHGTVFIGADNVTIDNFCIKFTGSHAIGCGTTAGITVTNCEIGWIGGSIQPDAYNSFYHQAARYGNGVELYGGCDCFHVENCWIYQCYDAGISHQYSSSEDRDIIIKNVSYRANLIEDCTYSIEYFLPASLVDGYTHMMENIIIENNICRRAGYGWGKQRPDKENPAHIKSWEYDNPAMDFKIQNNIFEYSTHTLLNVEAKHNNWLPTMTNNFCIETK